MRADRGLEGARARAAADVVAREDTPHTARDDRSQGYAGDKGYAVVRHDKGYTRRHRARRKRRVARTARAARHRECTAHLALTARIQPQRTARDNVGGRDIRTADTEQEARGQDIFSDSLGGNDRRRGQPRAVRYPPQDPRGEQPNQGQPAKLYHRRRVLEVFAGKHHHNAKRTLRRPGQGRVPERGQGTRPRHVRVGRDAVRRAAVGSRSQQRAARARGQGAERDRAHTRRAVRRLGRNCYFD